MTTATWWRPIVGFVLAGTMLAAACGGDDDEAQTGDDSEQSDEGGSGDETTTTADSDPDDSETQPPTTEAMDPAAMTHIGVAMTGLGDVLVDGTGRTLYQFDADQPTLPMPTCYDACGEAWPAVTVEGEPMAGEGVDPALLGTVARTDGTTQVIYNNWPLYFFSGDAAAGDTNGQGVAGVWHVVTPAGEPVRVET